MPMFFQTKVEDVPVAPWPAAPSRSPHEIIEATKTRIAEEKSNKWPTPLSRDAYQGLPGQFVDLVLPESEADPAVLLLTFLVGTGCLFGRDSYYPVEDTKHCTNMFTAVVGATSKARKGTGTDRARNLLKQVNPEWAEKRIRSGLTSGEGLVMSVRDERAADERHAADPGEPDKRLLVIESEFAQVLQMSSRDGNTLSNVMRDAWDGSPLRVMARSNKDSCQHPHISLIANITQEELLKPLSASNQSNGFANRILWCCAKRSKQLPYGGKTVDAVRMNALVLKIQQALAAASANSFQLPWDANLGRVTFDAEAGQWWSTAYDHLENTDATGTFEKVTARASAHVVRLATLYALLDSSKLIRIEHLNAAMEVWRYCEDSARYIFGDATGDSTVDTIYRALTGLPDGMTKTMISKLFNHNKPARELNSALELLERNRKIKQSIFQTQGANVTVWSRL